MEKYTNKYEVALAIAEKFGSTNANMSNIFEALLEIAQLKGLSVEGYSNKYDILKALAINEGVTSALSSSYDCLVGLASIYGGTNFSNNYEAALYLLENAEAGFGGLSFTATSTGTIGMSHHGTNATTTIPRLQYSRDGETWTDWMFESLSVNTGDKIYFKGINNTIATSNTNYSNFAFTGSFKANGNIMSLLYGDDYKEKVSLANKNYCFYGLFYGTKGILTSPKLPATTLSSYCYSYMFDGTNLTTMPELPATTLVYRCYYNMFANCKSLTATTKLPAKKLVGDCYRGMFNGCTSLNSVSADFNVMPTEETTEAWLNNVASEGTFYVASDAAWIDDVEFGPNTIPAGWRISGRTPHRKVNVNIDGVVYRLYADQTFAQQGYTELYSQAEFYPRFGQTAHDFAYDINSNPIDGLELFTTCTLAVNMINVTVDGNSYQVNYYTSWFANGFNLLYADNEFESESEVEEIDVDTTYPNEGDVVYTSYIIVKQWMRQVSSQTGISIANLKQAEDNYRFVDYLQSTGTQYINLGSNTEVAEYSFKYKVESSAVAPGGLFGYQYKSPYQGCPMFIYRSAGNIGLFFKGSSPIITVDYDNNWHTAKLSTTSTEASLIYDGITKTATAGTSAFISANMYLFANNYNNTRADVLASSISYFVMNNKYLIPAINASNQAIMLDLTTMREYTNAGTGSFEYGADKSLESKFNEMGYALPQWMYDIAEQTGIPVINLYNANNNYTFVDYLQSTGTQIMNPDITVGTLTKWTLSAKWNELSESGINGAFDGDSGIDMGAAFSTKTYFYRNGGASVCAIPVDTNKHTMVLDINGNSMFDTTVVPTTKVSVRGKTYNAYLFARYRVAQNNFTAYCRENIYYTIAEHTNKATQYLLPAINASGTAVMIDLMNMKEYTNIGTGVFNVGNTKSLESKFNEMGYGLPQWTYTAATQYNLLPEKIWEASNIDADVKKSFDGTNRRLYSDGTLGYFDNVFTISSIVDLSFRFKIQRYPGLTSGKFLFSGTQKSTSDLVQEAFNGYFRWGNGIYRTSVPAEYADDELEIVVNKNNITAYKDGVQVHTAAPDTKSTSTGAYGTLTLFRSPQNTASTAYWYGWVSFIEAKDNLSRMFLIPFNNNGVITLYDLIAGKALTPQGTQNFTIE